MRRANVVSRWATRIGLAALAGTAMVLFVPPAGKTSANDTATKAAPAMPVSVARVEPRETSIWDEFSGRLEAINRVEIRSRVSGAVLAAHFREGALVKRGDPLITIDPAPYAAEVERVKAQVIAAEARVTLTKKEQERAQQLQRSNTGAVSDSLVDQRIGSYREAEANLRAAEAALQSAELNLSYTEIRAPVDGRVGKLDITVGNLIAAGPGGPLLTTLVSVHPIYASFNADEQVVLRALKSLDASPDVAALVERIPVEMIIDVNQSEVVRGRMQLIDNQVDAASGTVRMRAMFDNQAGQLLPGQFVRLRMGETRPKPALLVSERAIGTDQNKKFVLVVDGANKIAYREVTLGAQSNGLRVVTSGLSAGELVVVNGLQRVRPGSLVAPEPVAMNATTERQAQTSGSSDIAQR